MTSLRVTMCRLCTALQMNLSKQLVHFVFFFFFSLSHTHTHGSQFLSILGSSHSTSAVSIPPSSCTCTSRPSLFLMASLVFSPSQEPSFIMVMESAMLTSMLALAWEKCILTRCLSVLDQKKKSMLAYFSTSRGSETWHWFITEVFAGRSLLGATCRVLATLANI